MLSPYADKPILLSLRSVTGLRYRVINCAECGSGMLERNGDSIFRLNNDSLPMEAHTDAGGQIQTVCGNCSQSYAATVSMLVSYVQNGIPLNKQPQTIYIVSEPVKKLRDVQCYECGHAFFSMSDRIHSIVDDVAPLNLIAPERMGPIEYRCHFQHCKQTFYVRV